MPDVFTPLSSEVIEGFSPDQPFCEDYLDALMLQFDLLADFTNGPTRSRLLPENVIEELEHMARIQDERRSSENYRWEPVVRTTLRQNTSAASSLHSRIFEQREVLDIRLYFEVFDFTDRLLNEYSLLRRK